MRESSVDGMIRGPLCPPRDFGLSMATRSRSSPASLPRPAELKVLSSENNLVGGRPSVVPTENPLPMDLAPPVLVDGGDESSDESKASVNARIVDAADLSATGSATKKRRRASNFPRRSRADGDDYLSNLTDHLLHHIFSLLPALDVVRTSTLARRWKNVWKETWTNSPSLTFSLPPSMCGRLESFSKIIDKALVTNDGSSELQRLHLSIPFDWSLGRNVSLWLKTAVHRNVRDLSLELSEETYELPEVIYYCSSIVHLSFRMCMFEFDDAIDWPSLRVLMLDRVVLTDGILKEIFRGSPALEFLKLYSCVGFQHIEVNSKSMREMVIGYENTIDADEVLPLVLSVSAPYLQVLRLMGDWTDKTVRRLHVPSLLEAELKFLENTHSFDNRSFGLLSSLLKRLLEMLTHVSKLTIDHSCLQLGSTFEMQGLFFSSMQTKNLILKTEVDRWAISGIARVIGSSEFLEKLVIDMTSSSISKLPVESLGVLGHDEELFWQKTGKNLRNLHCLKYYLKHVEIVSFDASYLGSKAVLGLIKFLLGRAMVLEKMVINVDGSRGKNTSRSVDPGDLWKLLEATHKIQGYPRGSVNSELVFNYRFKGCSFSMDM